MLLNTIFRGGAGVMKDIPQPRPGEATWTVCVVSAPDLHSLVVHSFVHCKLPSCLGSHASLLFQRNAQMTAG